MQILKTKEFPMKNTWNTKILGFLFLFLFNYAELHKITWRETLKSLSLQKDHFVLSGEQNFQEW